jgi:hypothetical protein
MGELNPNYPVMEIAISLVSYAPLVDGHERIIEGDIVAVRKPDKGIGREEAMRYLWLRIEGLEENEYYNLTDSIVSSAGEYDKRRFTIPLEKLEEIHPNFDINLAKEEDHIYQPFLLVDYYDRSFLYVVEDGYQPFQVSGLIYDKAIGDYL